MDPLLLNAAHRWFQQNQHQFDQHNRGERAQKMEVEVPGGRRTVWLKVVTNNKRTFWHRCQGGLAAVLRLPILRPTVSSGGKEGLQREVLRLHEARQAGFHVPEVLAHDDRVMVLSDLGPAIRTVLKSYLVSPQPESHFADVESLLLKATDALCQLHEAGIIHGRPHVKDFTWSEGRIGFLDFEEDPTEVMSWHEARARDVWLFMVAASGHFANSLQRDEVLSAMLELFFQRMDEQSLAALTELVRAFRPVRRLMQILLVRPLELIGKTAGRDVRKAVYASLVMERFCLGNATTDANVAEMAA